MLLALDVGNTNLTIGAFDGAKLLAQWRLRTVQDQTADEWGILLRNLFALSGHDISRVDGVIISSVVPPLDLSLAAMAQRYFRSEAFFINPSDAGLAMRVDHPSEVGADRVVNGVAAFHK
jgi:type III pantothenate kinase